MRQRTYSKGEKRVESFVYGALCVFLSIWLLASSLTLLFWNSGGLHSYTGKCSEVRFAQTLILMPRSRMHVFYLANGDILAISSGMASEFQFNVKELAQHMDLPMEFRYTRYPITFIPRQDSWKFIPVYEVASVTVDGVKLLDEHSSKRYQRFAVIGLAFSWIIINLPNIVSLLRWIARKSKSSRKSKS